MFNNSCCELAGGQRQPKDGEQLKLQIIKSDQRLSGMRQGFLAHSEVRSDRLSVAMLDQQQGDLQRYLSSNQPILPSMPQNRASEASLPSRNCSQLIKKTEPTLQWFGHLLSHDSSLNKSADNLELSYRSSPNKAFQKQSLRDLHLQN